MKLKCNYKVLTKLCQQSRTKIVDKQKTVTPLLQEGLHLAQLLCNSTVGALSINQIGCVKDEHLYISGATKQQIDANC